MHVHIATMGQVTEPVTKAFHALGYDRLYLLTSQRYQNSVDTVKGYLSGFDVEVHQKNVTGFDFQEIVNAINSVYEEEKGKGVDFSINITGGTNLMAAAACSCAFFIGATIYYVLMGDASPKELVKQIPTPKTPNMAALKPETRNILRYILDRTERNEQVTTLMLMDEFDRTKQSVNYQINILRNEGLVMNGEVRNGAGIVDRRLRSIELTDSGRLIANWI